MKHYLRKGGGVPPKKCVLQFLGRESKKSLWGRVIFQGIFDKNGVTGANCWFSPAKGFFPPAEGGTSVPSAKKKSKEKKDGLGRHKRDLIEGLWQRRMERARGRQITPHTKLSSLGWRNSGLLKKGGKGLKKSLLQILLRERALGPLPGERNASPSSARWFQTTGPQSPHKKQNTSSQGPSCRAKRTALPRSTWRGRGPETQQQLKSATYCENLLRWFPRSRKPFTPWEEIPRILLRSKAA